MQSLQPSTNDNQPATSVLRHIRAQHPAAPFLALGQTVWWDEPMKAVLRVLLDEADIGGHMVLGVHDTDYFAKAHTRLSGDKRFELLPHNDGATKDLWSAAGEISALFGSECFPTRHTFTRHGIPFNLVAAKHGERRQAFIDEVTCAWGWRGLVYTAATDTIVSELRLRDVAPGIRHMLEWGFDGTVDAIDSPDVREQAQRIGADLIAECCEGCRSHPEATLTHLYQRMYPRLLSLVMGRSMHDYSVTSTSELLRFAPDTCHRPRFGFVDLFLNPATRRLAADAYNDAVSGSDIYTLDKFGLGALPFDLVVPGHGRGTLRVTLRAVHIETRNPIRIRLERPIESVADLAAVLTRHLGSDLVLVGKAVALISMLAREFVFVFNEAGSLYVHRTREMNNALRSRGVSVPAYPIVRLHYQTWDSAAEVDTVVRLPEPFRIPFGAQALPMSTVASRWRAVSQEQQQLLDELADIRSTRALLTFLEQREPTRWIRSRDEYDRLLAELRAAHDATQSLARETADLHAELRQIKAELPRREAEKSAHFRSVKDWNAEERNRRAALSGAVTSLLERRRTILRRLRDLRAMRRNAERSDAVIGIRNRLREITLQAEEARLRIVRDAILVTEGMEHTDHRPTAWWLPMVDPSGAWFRRIVETTRAYLEPL
ncbi:MAG: hypothetical protein GX446_10295 [Chthonomonadales bacterium]|nr:hypothetical protein [Chthonomonadales bacterium]